MNSPFPGMDPYLEQYWSDVHSRLTIYSSDQLNQSLPPGLFARCETRLVVQDFEDDHERWVRPGVVVTEFSSAPFSDAEIDDGGVAVATAVAEPIRVRVRSEEEIQHFVEIIDMRDGDRVVTFIEFISPSNKQPGEGLTKYQQKQRECRVAAVNLVEIDLTRTPGREHILKLRSLPRRHRETYLVSVWRAATHPDEYEFYPLPLRRRLAKIRIPLRPTDADVVLDLQPLIDLTYRNGAYGRIDYSRPLELPLPADDTAWVAERVALAKSNPAPAR